MGQFILAVTNFNQWTSGLPIYLQVFLGMLAFLLTCSIAGFLIYGLLLLLQRMSHYRPLSSLTGVLGYAITLCLGWLLYIFIPLTVIALGNHEQLNVSLLTQTMGPYFGLFLLLSLSLADALEANGRWHHKGLSFPAKLFATAMWLLALGIPAIKHLRKPQATN